MTTVGAWLVRNKIEPFSKIYEDLIEMAIGVQSSQRGLFLRAFILQKIRYLIKNISNYPNIKIIDCIKIILINFGEMNKLWVRMEYLGHSKSKNNRGVERTNIRMLLGKNLVYMSEIGMSTGGPSGEGPNGETAAALTLEIYEYLIQIGRAHV